MLSDSLELDSPEEPSSWPDELSPLEVESSPSSAVLELESASEDDEDDEEDEDADEEDSPVSPPESELDVLVSVFVSVLPLSFSLALSFSLPWSWLAGPSVPHPAHPAPATITTQRAIARSCCLVIILTSNYTWCYSNRLKECC